MCFFFYLNMGNQNEYLRHTYFVVFSKKTQVRKKKTCDVHGKNAHCVQNDLVNFVLVVNPNLTLKYNLSIFRNFDFSWNVLYRPLDPARHDPIRLEFRVATFLPILFPSPLFFYVFSARLLRRGCRARFWLPAIAQWTRLLAKQWDEFHAVSGLSRWSRRRLFERSFKSKNFHGVEARDPD